LTFFASSEGPPHVVASYNTQGDAEDLFLPGFSQITVETCDNAALLFRALILKTTTDQQEFFVALSKLSVMPIVSNRFSYEVKNTLYFHVN
jgi:hypothetical protein